jgi:hypothetical protein
VEFPAHVIAAHAIFRVARQAFAEDMMHLVQHGRWRKMRALGEKLLVRNAKQFTDEERADLYSMLASFPHDSDVEFLLMNDFRERA